MSKINFFTRLEPELLGNILERVTDRDIASLRLTSQTLPHTVMRAQTSAEHARQHTRRTSYDAKVKAYADVKKCKWMYIDKSNQNKGKLEYQDGETRQDCDYIVVRFRVTGQKYRLAYNIHPDSNGVTLIAVSTDEPFAIELFGLNSERPRVSTFEYNDDNERVPKMNADSYKDLSRFVKFCNEQIQNLLSKKKNSLPDGLQNALRKRGNGRKLHYNPQGFHNFESEANKLIQSGGRHAIKVMNTKTGRMVLATGKVGRSIVNKNH